MSILDMQKFIEQRLKESAAGYVDREASLLQAAALLEVALALKEIAYEAREGRKR